MARTPSSMVPLGTPLPAFSLPDAAAEIYASDTLMGPKGLLVVFMCNHCPFVTHLARELGQVAEVYRSRGVHTVGINSNDALAYVDDAPSRMPAFAAEYGIAFPYLFDATQSAASAFNATCTPDFFLYNADGSLVYRGQFDATRPGDGAEVTGTDLCAALDALCDGRPIDAEQSPSIGCNIKWKPTQNCGETP